MKIEVLITKREMIELPDDLVAKMATEHFKQLGPELYADLLCWNLDGILKNLETISHDPVGIAQFAAQMTLNTVMLVEILQERVHQLDILDAAIGEKYELYNDRDYSPAGLSRLIGQPIEQPTMMQAKALCQPLVNVHGQHYRAEFLPVVSSTAIMTQNGNMFAPTEVFWHGDHVCGWDGFMGYAKMKGPFIKDIPVTFTSRLLGAKVEGTLMDLFLDRCVFNEEITEAIGVKYYVLPEETREELR